MSETTDPTEGQKAEHTDACEDYNHDAGWRVYRCTCQPGSNWYHDPTPVEPDADDVEAMTAVIKTEREKHTDLGPEQMVFNVRCVCGHIGQQVSVRGEFERHVDAAVARAVLAHISETDSNKGTP